MKDRNGPDELAGSMNEIGQRPTLDSEENPAESGH